MRQDAVRGASSTRRRAGSVLDSHKTQQVTARGHARQDIPATAARRARAKAMPMAGRHAAQVLGQGVLGPALAPEQVQVQVLATGSRPVLRSLASTP